ncbi:hypothetical protein GE21DRAFT_6933 [Neurospora crassa]|uniref:Uncharacterized protein n=1 Tax=Neurospora crassa (strain ATCC 24698 / 74-OR23-1A / CBS 708.71 / DSM 1257 / FGSC 987) TaxID=367110 RepID=V5IKZ0_NEUCR|nr:hypothetical protein NCU16925 [Neurospora crassa OR74A]ESA42363.1 hypothetical protein NCU16925 [Neurospora crassa OR74A]KHE84988.1 hypothetical protein GE21DRAFT_6933 [Neurospora crassa]|eukprot:XP_011394805.1 hypothetical protein NCU16925 [Neurospora crassa OR74A]
MIPERTRRSSCMWAPDIEMPEISSRNRLEESKMDADGPDIPLGTGLARNPEDTEVTVIVNLDEIKGGLWRFDVKDVSSDGCLSRDKEGTEKAESSLNLHGVAHGANVLPWHSQNAVMSAEEKGADQLMGYYLDRSECCLAHTQMYFFIALHRRHPKVRHLFSWCSGVSSISSLSSMSDVAGSP